MSVNAFVRCRGKPKPRGDRNAFAGMDLRLECRGRKRIGTPVAITSRHNFGSGAGQEIGFGRETMAAHTLVEGNEDAVKDFKKTTFSIVIYSLALMCLFLLV